MYDLVGVDMCMAGIIGYNVGILVSVFLECTFILNTYIILLNDRVVFSLVVLVMGIMCHQFIVLCCSDNNLEYTNYPILNMSYNYRNHFIKFLHHATQFSCSLHLFTSDYIIKIWLQPLNNIIGCFVTQWFYMKVFK